MAGKVFYIHILDKLTIQLRFISDRTQAGFKTQPALVQQSNV
jgi:hypothetical protein